ncbi:TPA: hypothetical protein NKP22_004206 [Vibrio parahaemolyticus]|nr:hypothetical protein [Vibrio parahaemolyticus]
MKKEYSTSERFALSISKTPIENQMENLRSIVLRHAINSKLISEEDRSNNSPDYQWLNNEIKRRIKLLSFLSQVIVEHYSPDDLDAVSKNINSKVETVVKQIIQEIIQSKRQFSSAKSTFGGSPKI